MIQFALCCLALQVYLADSWACLTEFALKAQLLEHLNNDHAEVMQGLEKGFKLPGNAADEIVDVATQVIVKWLKSKQADNKVYL